MNTLKTVISRAAWWASVSAPTLIVDVPLDGLWVLSLSNGEIDDHLSRVFTTTPKMQI